MVAHAHRLAHILPKLGFAMYAPHRTTAEHVARAHEHRIADRSGLFDRLGFAYSSIVFGLLNADACDELAKFLAILRYVYRARTRADDLGSHGA